MSAVNQGQGREAATTDTRRDQQQTLNCRDNASRREICMYSNCSHYIISHFSLLILTLLTYFRRTLLPSVSSRYTIGHLSFTQLLTSVIGIPISLYHFRISSSHRFCGLPLGRFPTGWITSALLWGAVGAVLLTCDHHLILFLFVVCSAGCMFTRHLISSFMILSILVFPVHSFS